MAYQWILIFSHANQLTTIKNFQKLEFFAKYYFLAGATQDPLTHYITYNGKNSLTYQPVELIACQELNCE